jgi:hypothetical protein
MRKNWKIVTIVIAIVLIGMAIGIYRSIKKENIHFNKVELTQNNFIKNATDLAYLDTVASVGLDILDIKMVTIFIRPLSIKNNDENIDYKAHIIAGKTNQGLFKQYLIEIDKNNKRDIISTISHELIHLKQYKSNRLKMTEEYVVWENDTLMDNVPDYFDRPWEIEAEKEGKALEKKIRAILYSEN